jgi:hypothetical protein
MPAIDEGKDRGSNGEATPRRAAQIAVPFKPATTGSARASEPAVVLGLAGEAAEALEDHYVDPRYGLDERVDLFARISSVSFP